MPATPALVRPRPFESDFGPFATSERQVAGTGVLLAIERFSPQPTHVTVENQVLRICRHLDRPLRFERQGRGGKSTDEFIAPGQHFIFGAGATGRFAWQAGFRTLSLNVTDGLLRSMEVPLPGQGIAVCADDPVLERLTALALLDAEEGFPRGELFAEGLGLAAAAHLIGCAGEGRGPMPPGGRDVLSVAQLRSLREVIEARLPERPGLQELAAAAGWPALRLGVAFRRSTGTSLWDYVAGRRLALAEELLRDPELSLGVVAFRAGYSSQAHMTTAFRRHRGLTPAAWRKLRGIRLV